MLKSMTMPADFWGEAVHTAMYLLNRSPTRSLKGQTSYEAWMNRTPAVGHLRTFGCVAHMKRTGPGITKLSDRSMHVVFIGYEEGRKAYRVFDPVSKKLHITRDAVFEERRAWNWTVSGTVAQVPSTITVVYATDPGQIITDDGRSMAHNGAADGREDAAPHTPATPATPSTPSSSTPGATIPATPVMPSEETPEPASTAAPAVTWCFPLSQDNNLDAEDDGTGQLCYRRVSNIYDTTEPAEEEDHDTRCLLAAEEPATVEEALADDAWR
jgi:hypothetical protein